MAPVTRGIGRAAVVFSSGFFGFFAHAGVLSALRALSIRPIGYAGTSSGAIVAAMAASGMDDQSIRTLLFNLKKSDFWDPNPFLSLIRDGLRGFKGTRGYLRGQGFARLLSALPVNRMEDCPKPLAISATNLTERKETVFTRGDLAKAVQASGAVPILFEPVNIDGILYLDGGIVNKAPVQTVVALWAPETVIVHYIPSHNLERSGNQFLEKRLTPFRIHHLATNIARHEAYLNQLERVRAQGVRLIEIRTKTPPVGPTSLKTRGHEAYELALKTALDRLATEMPQSK
jgi:NTE family protein